MDPKLEAQAGVTRQRPWALRGRAAHRLVGALPDTRPEGQGSPIGFLPVSVVPWQPKPKLK